MNLSNQRNNQNNDLNLNIYAPYKGFISANRLSSEKNKNRMLVLNEERKDNIVLFNTFSSKPKIEENKSQKLQNVHIKNKEGQKSQKIKKAKSVNYNKIKYYDNEEDKKRDSYLYLVKLKKYYSMHNNLYNINKSKYSSQSHGYNSNKRRVSTKSNEIEKTHEYENINNYYAHSKLNMTIDSNNKQFNIYKKIIKGNESHSCFNKNNNNKCNDISEIINTRIKFNETYNYFYNMKHSNLNKCSYLNQTKQDITNKNNNTSDYSSLNNYWNKRTQDNSKKIVKIRNELFNKEQDEIQSVPQISNKSKELVNNSNKSKSDNFKYKNIFDKLFNKKNINDSSISRKKRYNNKPKINQKSEKMTRTLDDLFLWNNKKQKKIKENENKIYKKEIFHKKNINLTSESILKERRPFYLNKKVEDRLIEQGKSIKIKNSKIKEKFINEITEQKKYSNINFNHNKSIKSKYMPKEESKNNENNNSFLKHNSNIFNFNYDYNINIFNKRNSLFDKNKNNIIKELNDKSSMDKKSSNRNSRTLLLQNYMKNKINYNRNNVNIIYNKTDLFNYEIKDKNNIKELKLNLINRSDKNDAKEKDNNVSYAKDKRLEDLKKIMDFSEKLYKSQNKIIS